MAKKTKDELLNAFNVIAGENNSDEILAFIEDLTDSFENGDDETVSKADYDKLQNDYNELDKSWRQKYRDRFNQPSVDTKKKQ